MAPDQPPAGPLPFLSAVYMDALEMFPKCKLDEKGVGDVTETKESQLRSSEWGMVRVRIAEKSLSPQFKLLTGFGRD